MASVPGEALQEQRAFFRAGKKRKSYRQRAADDVTMADEIPFSNTLTTTTTAIISSSANVPALTVSDTLSKAAPVKQDDDNAQEEPLVADVLRRRIARKPRHCGVAFRAERGGDGDFSSIKPSAYESSSQSLVTHERERPFEARSKSLIGIMTTRFAPQTGLVGEMANRYMEEYVESELARRQRLAKEHSVQQHQQQLVTQEQDGKYDSLVPHKLMAAPVAHVLPAPAARGKLMEIDLGDETRERNVMHTERALRLLRGAKGGEKGNDGGDGREDADAAGLGEKGRLGPDGMPWRPKNRRGSDDILRDNIVEELLHENRPVDALDISMGAEDEEMEDEEWGGDDKIAAQFRRNFMEAMQQRRRRRHMPVNATKAKPKQPRGDILRGPKLGGSRNMRQVIRDQLLKKQEKKPPQVKRR